jgi:hypothetical protein
LAFFVDDPLKQGAGNKVETFDVLATVGTGVGEEETLVQTLETEDMPANGERGTDQQF